MMATELIRCPWAKGDEYIQYHDMEWGFRSVTTGCCWSF